MSTSDETFPIPVVLTPEALQRGERVYPEHIYDPTRIQIATEILGKEIAKLVVAQSDAELEAHRGVVGEWFKGTEQELSPVHDFWSTFELLPMVKTKRLARFVTAQNVDWRPENVELNKLVLTWMPFIEHHPEFSEGPWSVSAIRSIFAQHPDIHAEASEQNRANRSRYGFNRDNDPITIVTRDDEVQYLLDGNGRLYAAIMAGRDEIRTWHGHMTGTKPENYWVSTGLIKDLCYTIADEAEANPEVANAALVLLRTQLASNDIAKANYHIWIKQYFPELTEQLTDVL
jgi:hypothetical protein